MPVSHLFGPNIDRLLSDRSSQAQSPGRIVSPPGLIADADQFASLGQYGQFIFDAYDAFRYGITIAELGANACGELVDRVKGADYLSALSLIAAIGHLGCGGAVALFRQLGSCSDAFFRGFLCQAAAMVDGPEAIQFELEMVEDPDDRVRLQALEALTRLAYRLDSHFCDQLMADSSDYVRAAAFKTYLQQNESVDDLGVLINAMRNRATDVRVAAAERLHHMDDPRLLVVMLDALEDSKMMVGKYASRWLKPRAVDCAPHLAQRLPTARGRYSRQSIVDLLRDAADPATIPILIEELRSSGNKEVRQKVIKALKPFCQRSEVFDTLCRAVDDQAPEVVKEAAGVLASSGNSASIRFIRERLEKWHLFDDHKALVKALCRFNHPEAIDALIAHVDRSYYLEDACKTLVKFKAFNAIPVLERRLRVERKQPSYDVKPLEAALLKLRELQAKGGAPTGRRQKRVASSQSTSTSPDQPLSARLVDASADVRLGGLKQLAIALRQPHDRAISAFKPRIRDLMEDPDARVRKAAIAAYPCLTEPADLDDILALLQEASPERQRYLIEMLAGLGSRETGLRLAQTDIELRTTRLRAAYAKALEMLGCTPDEIQGALLYSQIIQRSKDTDNLSEALVNYGPSAIPVLRQLMLRTDHRIWKSAAKALSQLGYAPVSVNEQAIWYAAHHDTDGVARLGPEAVGIYALLLGATTSEGDRRFLVSAIVAYGGPRAILDPLRAYSVNVEGPVITEVLKTCDDMTTTLVNDMLLDHHQAVCRVGVELARQRRFSGSLPTLYQLLDRVVDDPDIDDAQLEWGILYAIGIHGDERDMTPLLEREHRFSSTTHAAMLKTIYTLGGNKARFMLLRALSGPSFETAAEIIKRAGWQPSEPLARARFEVVTGSVETVAALGEIGAEAILALLARPHGHVRDEFISLLGQYNPPRVIEALSTTTQDLNWNAVRDVLIGFGKDATLALVQMASSPRRAARDCSAEVLATLKDPRSEAALLELARRECDRTKRYAIVGLGFIKSREALAVILPCLTQKDLTLQRACVEALGRIQAPEALEPLRTLRQSAPKKLLPAIEKAISRLERI